MALKALRKSKLQAVPQAAKPFHGTLSDARCVVRTQGHVRAMIGARQGVGMVLSQESAASATSAPLPAALPPRRAFRGEPGQVPLVRNFVSCCLDGRRCPAETVQDILACATELAANAVLHSRSGLPGGYFTVEVACARQSAHVTVADSGGPWTERGNAGIDAECGRGLRIVAALSADSGIAGDDAGRVAWFCCRWGAGEDGQPAYASCSGTHRPARSPAPR